MIDISHTALQQLSTCWEKTEVKSLHHHKGKQGKGMIDMYLGLAYSFHTTINSSKIN